MYVKRAGELKKHRRSVYDPKREQIILKKVGSQAVAMGYPAVIAIAVFKAILKQSVRYEKGYHH